MLTKKELRRLAKEARVLAMECVEGTAPQLDGYNWGYCAIGELAHRIKYKHSEGRVFAGMALNEELTMAESDAVECALYGHNAKPNGGKHAAVVFPLLALADALEGGIAEDAPRGAK